MQIFILGMHRSGTSAVARLINMMGAYFGAEGCEMVAQSDNPKGFWERRDICALNDDILNVANAKWDNVSKLDFNMIESAKLTELENRAKSLIFSMDANRPWFIKDPRICLTMPFYAGVLEVPVTILVYRNPYEVALSLRKRNGIPVFVGIALWEFYMVSAINASRNSETVVVDYAKLLSDPLNEVDRIFNDLVSAGVDGLRLPAKREIEAFINADLYHERAENIDWKGFLNLKQQQLVSLCTSSAGLELETLESIDVSKHALEVLSEYDRLSDINCLNKELDDMLQEARSENDLLLKEAREMEQRFQVDKDRLLEKAKEMEQRFQVDKDRLLEEAKEMEQRYKTVKAKLLDGSRSSKRADAQQLCEIKEKMSVLTEVAVVLDFQVKELNIELSEAKGENNHQYRWLRDLKIDTDMLFSTFSWRIGSMIVKVIDLLRFKVNQPTVKNHIEKIFNEYDDFIHTNKVNHSMNNEVSKDKAEGAWRLLCRLSILALKDPCRTVQLFEMERFKNLYITMFSASSHTQKGVFDYYLDMYSSKSDESTQVLQESTFNSLSNDTASVDVPLFDEVLVSIVIPVFNQWEYTSKCIRSIVSSVNKIQYEIILADDNSSDTTKSAKQMFAGITVIRSDKNNGFLLNCNNAAKYARGEFIVFLNNDTIVHNGWLEAMLDVMERDVDVGITGSKLIYEDGKLQEAGGIVWCDGSGWNYGRQDDPDCPEYSYVREVDYISGASIMIRTGLWQEIGGFDERYVPAYYEDTDLAFEVRKLGYKVVYTPFSVVTHFEGQSHGTSTNSGIKRYQVENRGKFTQKWKTVLNSHYFENGVDVFLARENSGIRKKTILVIDHYVPHFDRDAGSRSTFQYLLWFVRKGMHVKFIGDNFFKHEPYTMELQKNGIEVLYGHHYAKNWKKWLKENGQYIDYAYLHRPHIAPKYIDSVRKYTNAKIIYFGHDLHYLRTERQYQLEKNKDLLKSIKDWKKREFDVFKKVDVIYYPSIIEEDEVKKHFPDKRVAAIPLNIYEPIKAEPTGYERRSGLMFVGGFGHEPNIDAIKWFVSNVMPIINNENGGIVLSIMGSNIPSEIESLASNNILVLGEVSDSELQQCYKNSRVVIAPLRYGAGIKGKVLEGLYNQVPVVTTCIGAEGLPLPNDYLMVANEAQDFAESINTVYEDKEVWERLVNNGVACINNHFSSNSVEKVIGQDIDFQ